MTALLLAAFAFCIPFGDFHPPGAAGFLSVTKICFILLVAAAVATRAWLRLKISWADVWPLVLLGGGLLSAVNAVVASSAIFEAARLAGMIMLFFVARAVLWNERAARMAQSALIAAGAAMAVLGIVQTLTGATIPGVGIYGPYQSLVPVEAGGQVLAYRAAGAFAHPNELGLFLLAAIAAAFARLCSGEPGAVKKIFVYCALAAQVAALVYTFSRSAWLGLALMCVAALLALGPRRFSPAFCAALLAAAAAVAFLPAGGRAALYSRSSQVQRYDAGRPRSWRAATAMIADHPFAGIGLGMFAERFEDYAPRGTARDPWQKNDAHNTVLAIAAEAGMPAAAAAMFGFGAAFIAAWRKRRGAQARAPFLALCGMLPALMLNSFQYEEALWFMMGWAMAAAPGDKRIGSRVRVPVFYALVAAALAAVALVFAAALAWRFASWPLRGLTGRMLIVERTPLAAMKRLHPRIYFQAADLELLAKNAGNGDSPRFAVLLEWIEKYADNIESVGADPDLRQLARTVPPFALAHKVFGKSDVEGEYLEQTFKRVELLCSRLASEVQEEINIAESIYALSLVFDWLHDELGEERKAAVLRAIARGAEEVLAQMIVFPPLNNHRTVDAASLGVAGMACYGHLPQAGRWITAANRELEYVARYFSEDGISPEGVSYASYTIEYLLKYYAAAEPLLKVEIKPESWIRAYPEALLYHTIPAGFWTEDRLVMSFGDGPRQAWHGPGYLNSFIARRFDDGLAQWLAEQILERRADGESSALWLYALWHDGAVPARGPAEAGMPLFKYFDNWGIYSARDSWSGNESVALFKCSPAGGRKLRRGGFGYPGLGHTQPDANSFQIFAAGEYLAAHPGPTTLKLTSHHNTILVDGRGQTGEGGEWMRGRSVFHRGRAADIVLAEHAADYDYAVGRGEGAYDEEDLDEFTRHFFWARPGPVVICDVLTCRPGAEIAWLLHSDAESGAAESRGFRFDKDKASMFVRVLAPAGAVLTCGAASPHGHYKWGVAEWKEFKSVFRAPPSGRVVCLAVVAPVEQAAAQEGFPEQAASEALRKFIAVQEEKGLLPPAALEVVRRAAGAGPARQ